MYTQLNQYNMCNGLFPSQEELSAFCTRMKIFLTPRPFDESHIIRDAILSLYLRKRWALNFSPLNIQELLENLSFL